MFIGKLSIRVVAIVSCVFWVGACGSNTGNSSVNLIANANGVKKTPVPDAADCPKLELTLDPKDFIERNNSYGQKVAGAQKYVGCKAVVAGKLTKVYTTAVVLTDTVGDLIGKENVSCSGNFSNETFTKVGEKLSGLSEGADWAKFPTVQVSGNVKQVEGSSDFQLTECVLIRVLSGGL